MMTLHRIYVKWQCFIGKGLDIWSTGKYPCNVLSNLCSNAFEIDGVKCAGMEGFLQSLKYQDANRQREICSMKGKEAKKTTTTTWQKDQIVWWQGTETHRQGDDFQQLVRRAYNAMFEQNKNFRTALMATRGKTLYHCKGCNDPYSIILTRDELCTILMELRDGYDKKIIEKSKQVERNNTMDKNTIANINSEERKDYVIPLMANGEPYPEEIIEKYSNMDGGEFWGKWGNTDGNNILELIDMSVLVKAENKEGILTRERFAEITMSMLPSVVRPMSGLNLINMGLLRSMRRVNFTATPIFPVVFLGWGGAEADCQTFAFYPKSFGNGYIEVKCDGRGVEIAEDVSSGVKVVAWNDDSTILEVDNTMLKDSLSFGRNGEVNTNRFGGYAFSLREYGEFLVEIYFKPKADIDMDKVLLFTYNFCCK